MFTPVIVKDVVHHMKDVLHSGGKLRTINKRTGVSKAVHGAKIALGMSNSYKDLYLWHPQWTIRNGVYSDFISIHDLEPKAGTKWQVLYRVLLLGGESDYAGGADRLGGNRLGVANEAGVDVRGSQIVVDFEMSGIAFLKMFDCNGGRMGDAYDVLKQQMKEKWGDLGQLFGTPGKKVTTKTTKNEGYEFVRMANGQRVCNTGGPEGSWINLDGPDWKSRYKGKV
jgi:hypothetical protein